MDIRQLLKERILILDGGMGTMVQRHNLTEADYRGELFRDAPGQQKGNNDLLCLTQPAIIQDIHRQYLEVGADIIETNTLNSNAVSMSDYGMDPYVTDINLNAARIAREVADEFTAKTPGKPRFVAGSIGPTNKSASISPDLSNPGIRNITFDDLRTAYKAQIKALITGGVDLILIETSFDTLNVKAALMAAEEGMEELQQTVPLMVSFTLSGKNGRLLSGQTLEAAFVSISHANLLSIGLNCSFGASDMKPFIKELGRIAPYYISAYPNAGLPDSLGQYAETPDNMALQIKEYIEEGLVNIIGGCCGTTPDHIAKYADLIEGFKPHLPAPPIKHLCLAGLEVLRVTPENNFINIGERCNVAGSRKFLRLIKEKNYDEALVIARQQVENGAQVLDINMDDGLLDGAQEMTTFLNLIASEPDIARVPIMIDSSDWNVIEAGLKCLQGKPIVNSISLKEGEAEFIEKAIKIRSYGAAVVVMAFDEKGQADSFERKIEICKRAYLLLTEKAGYQAHDIIFDPNVLAIATGIDEHRHYAVDFIRATEWIKQHLPGSKVSGGISNLSFSFRGNNYIRGCMHAVFLYHAIGKGMDMGIVDPSSAIVYEDIPADVLELIEDVIFNRKVDAAERLTEFAQQNSLQLQENAQKQESWRSLPLDERLQHALIQGNDTYLETDLAEALNIYSQPTEIIDGVLMAGMNRVGNLFGEGKVFLPQVVKSARTMKKAVKILEPAIIAANRSDSVKAGKILMATVKGDVHDIGKNIAGVILSCNNYEIIDIGVMVPSEEIISKIKENEADIVGLSGLITPSLHEMSFVASELEREGLRLPLLIGGATTSMLHTALKIDPLYSGPVVHVRDASKAVAVVNNLMNPEMKDNYVSALKSNYDELRMTNGKQVSLVPLAYARQHALRIDWTDYVPPKPTFLGSKVIPAITIEDIIPYINWAFFLTAWKLSPKFAGCFELSNAEAVQQWLLSFDGEDRKKADETVRLMLDAKKMLSAWATENDNLIKAIIGFYPTNTVEGGIEVEGNVIPLLRQQEKRDDEVYKSLEDFFDPAGDYVGFFIVTADNQSLNFFDEYRKNGDTYKEILAQTLCDRLAEATAEYLHIKVRRDYWGYAPSESLDKKALFKSAFRGIRPASGYPSLPDISLNFTVDRLLDMQRIGVSLTPNGAIIPTASVCGMYIAHPESEYFAIGKIDAEQLAVYSSLKKITPEEGKKWLSVCL
ncbi:MAG: methionine synthase [Dysgonamonadaceae bacterium]|jgi:5-methyltetrahydrofolate--homocysteine methyltransferase|nr:methionine synthase [Dysgonamonadaceae bacterium]